jgi:hypothetical protein
MGGVDVAYDSAGLRVGAGGHLEAADAAGRVVSVLASAVVPAGVFGRVSAAGGFAATLEAARDGQGRSAGAEAESRRGLAARVGSAADQGDGLTAATTAVAGSVSGAVVVGMGG